ncbi:hypothetical protein BI364_15825 [Acidihalobacter yilgarnensis]|uniref:Superinfection exclusion protein B n=1 Tax=Acidihalobacter yilgarnensis TaxID=2819280 RepID=A0A1D8ITK1_9GAMM|nr:super-infection exclusion protein B [Acidihalobacter yilgarnensis]AOU99811.1 hypothetical protein BI364_15825 [Acidihalobacter yilgarnensis]
MDKLTALAEYFRKVPAAFLIAVLTVLGLVLFLPDHYAKILAIDAFRSQYRVFIGPTFLLVFAFSIARLFTYLARTYTARKLLKERKELLHKLTPEEKGYLVPYILNQQNSVYVGMDDGIMAGLRKKGITYLAANMGDLRNGFAFNLQPWAREYLQGNPQLLDSYAGHPMTPGQKLHSRWYS